MPLISISTPCFSSIAFAWAFHSIPCCTFFYTELYSFAGNKELNIPASKLTRHLFIAVAGFILYFMAD
jgi:Na+-transporting NADH:ubiquinone oxidoreductase subunit NqrB